MRFDRPAKSSTGSWGLLPSDDRVSPPMSSRRHFLWHTAGAVSFFARPSLAQSLPSSILRDLPWSFSEPSCQDVETLLSALREYSRSIGHSLDEQELQRQFPGRTLDVTYAYWVRDNGGVWTELSATVQIRRDHNQPMQRCCSFCTRRPRTCWLTRSTIFLRGWCCLQIRCQTRQGTKCCWEVDRKFGGMGGRSRTCHVGNPSPGNQDIKTFFKYTS